MQWVVEYWGILLLLVSICIIAAAAYGTYLLRRHKRCSDCGQFYMSITKRRPRCQLCFNKYDFAGIVDIVLKEETKLQCNWPGCNRIMEKHVTGGDHIFIDVCPEHGAFLNKGELRLIIDEAYARGYNHGLSVGLRPRGFFDRVIAGGWFR